VVKYHHGTRRSISITFRPRDAFLCHKLQDNPKGIINREIVIQQKLPCLRVSWLKYNLPRPYERQKPREKDPRPERLAHISIVRLSVLCNTNYSVSCQ